MLSNISQPFMNISPIQGELLWKVKVITEKVDQNFTHHDGLIQEIGHQLRTFHTWWTYRELYLLLRIFHIRWTCLRIRAPTRNHTIWLMSTRHLSIPLFWPETKINGFSKRIDWTPENWYLPNTKNPQITTQTNFFANIATNVLTTKNGP